MGVSKSVIKTADPSKTQTIKTALQQAIESIMGNGCCHAVQLHVDCPRIDLHWSGAVGRQSLLPEAALVSPEYPMRIASVTKTFVAVAILCLWEEGLLGLDEPIPRWISGEHLKILRKGGYKTEEITPRYLLTHTSGLFDYADSAAFEKSLLTEPDKAWSRTDQLNFAINEGSPYGSPGDIVRYSDTGYILLGEIVEVVSGLSLAQALRQLLNYQLLGLRNTWFDVIESPPPTSDPLVHQYFKNRDSFEINPSFDIFGGGGIISTVGDMALFIRSLFTGKIFKNSRTLLTMLSTVDANRGGPVSYGAFKQVPGSYRLGIDGGIDGRIFRHAGFWGTLVAFLPEHDVAIAISVNRFGGEDRQVLFERVLAILEVQS